MENKKEANLKKSSMNNSRKRVIKFIIILISIILLVALLIVLLLVLGFGPIIKSAFSSLLENIGLSPSTSPALEGVPVCGQLDYISGRNCEYFLGDANGDGQSDVSDIIHINDYLNKRGKLNCAKNADFNSDCIVDQVDGRELITYLLAEGRGAFTDSTLGDGAGVLSPGEKKSDIGNKPNERSPRIQDDKENEDCDDYTGDINGDSKIDISDFNEILVFLTGKHQIKCKANADINNDGEIDINDKNELRKYLFGEDKIAELCIDSEDGIEFGIKGSVIGNKDNEAFGKEDSCEDNVLVEYYCESDSLKIKRLECEGGCADGTCIDKRPVDILKEDICIDGDLGIEFGVKGIIGGYKDGESYQNEDSCTDKILTEHYCKDNKAFEKKQTCANGCINGACVDISCGNNPSNICDEGLECKNGVACNCAGECAVGLSCVGGRCEEVRGAKIDSCRDDDGGKNSGTKGTASGFLNGRAYTKTDSCKSDSILLEYSCEGNNLAENEFSCSLEEKCFDGKCSAEIAQLDCADNPKYTCDILSPSLCIEGQQCQCDVECTSPLKCINSICTPIPTCTNNPPGCNSELTCTIGQACSCHIECADGFQCKDNICASTACTTNDQCGTGLKCIDGRCKIPITISCENNFVFCQSTLNCPSGNKCDCYSECTSGYCWGNAVSSYVCKASCAPDGSYTNNPLNCCSGIMANGICISCSTNPPECNTEFSCNTGLSCNCNEECADGLICIDSKCIKESVSPPPEEPQPEPQPTASASPAP